MTFVYINNLGTQVEHQFSNGKVVVYLNGNLVLAQKGLFGNYDYAGPPQTEEEVVWFQSRPQDLNIPLCVG